MQDQEVKPAAIVAVDELAAQAQTPEDKELVESWRAEVATEREEALKSIGHNVLVAMPNGATATPEEVQRLRDAGQDVTSGSYNNGRRA